MTFARRRLLAQPGDIRCGWCMTLFAKRDPTTGKVQIKRGERGFVEFGLADRTVSAWCKKCKRVRLGTEIQAPK